MCVAIGSPSAKDKPNDPETVCDCARAYLKHVGQAITEIRNQAQELVGKGFTQAQIDQNYFGKDTRFQGLLGYRDPRYQGEYSPFYSLNDLLKVYLDGNGSLACNRWASDKTKLAELQKQQEASKENQEKAHASEDADAARWQADIAKHQKALRDLTEKIRDSHDLTERRRLSDQYREQQSNLFKEMAQHPMLRSVRPASPFGNPVTRQIDGYTNELAHLKPDTYRELQYTVRQWWELQVRLAQDQLTVVQGDEDKAENDLNQKWNDSTGELDRKWVAIWEQQLKAQESAHRTKDETQWADDLLALCRSQDSLLESELKDRVNAMQSIAHTLIVARDAIARQMQLWQNFAAQDGWPAGGSTDLAFGEFAHKLFEPEAIFFLAVKDPKPHDQRGAPQTSEEAKCLMCSLQSESPTIAAFWNRHPDCRRWNGQMPEGVRLIASRDKAAPPADASKLTPIRSNPPYYLELDPSESLAIADQKIVAGAADHDQP
jgi:hypothetical protein